MVSASGLFLAAVALVVAAAQAWFWWLRSHEERTVWLGCAAIAAAATLVSGVAVLLMAAFPESLNPWVEQLLLLLLAIPLVCLALFPVVLVVVLIASGIRLIRREGRSWRNMLSLALGIAMVVYVAIWPAVRASLVHIPYLGGALDFIFGFLAILIGIFGCAFAFYTVAGFCAQRPHRGRRYDAVIVLGCALRKDGTPTPLLANRVEKGIASWKAHPEARLIMSGGQGADEVQPESHAMRDFALSQGVPEEVILVEDRSTNTDENLRFSEEIREEEGLVAEGRVLIVTDDYHVFRALLISRNLGFAADGASSRVRLYFSLNALVREWVAYICLKRRLYAKLAIVLLALYCAIAAIGGLT